MNQQVHHYELLAVDFMVDDNMKLYLLESNSYPGMSHPCPAVVKVYNDTMKGMYNIVMKTVAADVVGGVDSGDNCFWCEDNRDSIDLHGFELLHYEAD